MPSAVPPIGYSATLTFDGSALLFPVSFDVPSGDVAHVDASFMGMPTKEKLFVAGLIDNGAFQFDALYCEADFRRLFAARGLTKTCVLTFPDDGTGTPPTYTFSGFLTKFPMKFEMENIPHMACEFKISGAITLG